MRIKNILLIASLILILFAWFYIKTLTGCTYNSEPKLTYKILKGYSLDNVSCLLDKLTNEILPKKSNSEKLSLVSQLCPLFEIEKKTYVYDWFKYGGIDDEDEYNEKKVEIKVKYYHILESDTIYFPILDSLYLKYKNDDFYAYDLQLVIINQIQQNDTFMNKKRYFKYVNSRVDTGIHRNLNLLLKFEYLHPTNTSTSWKTFIYPDSLYTKDSIGFY